MRLFEGTPFDRPPHCERCDALETECQCPPESIPPTPPEKQTAHILIEKRKRQKVVTLIKGLSPEETDLPKLLTILKSLCGAGGTLKQGTLKQRTLEIQGNHLSKITQHLKEMGYCIQN
ncbi:Translation initiation factor SUI1-related protein [hydrothermal vent metagenome]|uniref:Translation initiation factor SUI1-related protein n=1 Tax=hydrothermal vent metagenome TaxID=652676 RepID=A0A3B1DEF0_9ZZZZ